jgi:hypothetical protein
MDLVSVAHAEGSGVCLSADPESQPQLSVSLAQQPAFSAGVQQVACHRPENYQTKWLWIEQCSGNVSG